MKQQQGVLRCMRRCEVCGKKFEGKTAKYCPPCRSKRIVQSRGAEWRAKLSKKAKKRMADPERRRMLSEAAKKRFEDPEERARLSKKAKAWIKKLGNPMKGKKRPDLRRYNRLRVGTKAWEEAKAKMSRLATERLSDPEYRARISGENSYLWNGGAHDHYYGPEWAAISKEIRERDGACVHCGSKKGLTVHHVIPFSIVEEHDPENLKTLCRRCHARVHCAIKALGVEEDDRFELAMELAREASTPKVGRAS